MAIVGPPGLLIAFLIRSQRFLYMLGHGGVSLTLRMGGIRYRVIGSERLPRGRAAVYCSNHQSNADPPVLFEALHPQMHVLYKSELNKVPVLSHAFKLGGFVAVDRHNKEAALKSIDVAAASIRAGNSFLIFPEGTRSKTDDLLPFKKGGFIMAIRAQAPIVPIAVSGGRAAMRRGSWMIFPTLVTVRVGDPIETAGLTMEDRDRLIAQVRSAIQALLASDAARRPNAS